MKPHKIWGNIPIPLLLTISKPSDLKVYIYISSLKYLKENLCPTINQISCFCNISQRAAYLSLRSLKIKKLINVTNHTKITGQQDRNTYTICYDTSDYHKKISYD